MEKAQRVVLCKIGDIAVNGIKQVDAAGKKLCVLNGGDRVFACQATCPHEDYPLCDGVFDGETLTCLEHLWQWSLPEDGEPRGLAESRLEMYPVEVENGTVYLKTE
jgi:toluene monooxygenase system ferredoxin subunit